MKCEHCKKEIEYLITNDGKYFRNINEMEKHYIEELNKLRSKVHKLEYSILRWKEAWFELREIVGQLGYTYCIKYKKGMEGK